MQYMKYDNLANTMATLWEVVKKMADYHQSKVYKFKPLPVVYLTSNGACISEVVQDRSLI